MTYEDQILMKQIVKWRSLEKYIIILKILIYIMLRLDKI